jgi:hypothetical protein
VDAQQWLVESVLPGLERIAHLAGLLALLRKWTSRKVEGVSDRPQCIRHDMRFHTCVTQEPARPASRACVCDKS